MAGILVAGSVAGGLVAPAKSTSNAWQSGRGLPRAFGDRPDDFGGPQVHFMYVVPADGTDRQLDTNGLIDGVVSRIQQWLADQTNGLSLRVDAYQGQPDITYVQLPPTDAQVTATYPYPTFTSRSASRTRLCTRSALFRPAPRT